MLTNFQKTCLEMYEIDPACFLTAPRLAWQADVKETKGKLHLPTDINMLLMVKECIRGGICNAIDQYVKAKNKYMKDYDKNKELSYLKYGYVTKVALEWF